MSSVSINKASAAEVRETAANRVIRIIEIENPEAVFVNYLLDFFNEVGFSETYPNFGTINIGTVHPFALLLFAESKGDKLDFNVLPAITVVETSSAETDEMLGRDRSEVDVDTAFVEIIRSQIAKKEWFVSDTGLAALEAGTAGGEILAGVMHTHTANSTYVFDIWSANKDIASIIYDLVDSFLADINVEALHLKGIDLGTKSGRRSGDLNLDFGRILYGSSVSIQAKTRNTVMSINPVVDFIATITSDPEYHLSL